MSMLHLDRSSFVAEARHAIARLPANTPMLVGVLAGAAAISILAEAISGESSGDCTGCSFNFGSSDVISSCADL